MWRELKKASERGKKDGGLTPGQWAFIEAMRACGSLDYARAAALRESRAAVRSIEALPASGYKDSLLELASFSVTRDS